MHAIKIAIEGEYWDSHIYSGRLYLFSVDGAITTINWDSLIESWTVEKELRLAMKCAFSRSDYFYGPHWQPLFADSEVKSLIQSKFERLGFVDLLVDRRMLDAHLVSRQHNPFPFPHSDARIYGKRFYVSSQSGVFHAGCSKSLRHGVSTRPTKRWDCPVLSLSTYSNTLALAAGDEGLYEARVGDTSWKYSDEEDGTYDAQEIKQISTEACESCEWAYHSIFASSHIHDGFMAAFRLSQDDNRPRRSRTDMSLFGYAEASTQERTFAGFYEASTIFHDRGYSWANHDKVYQAVSGRINAKRYQPWKEEGADLFADLGTLELAAWKGEVVSAGVAVFGTIIECENAVVVLLSDGTPLTIPGEPVRWRAFPRSKHYENQLHIVREDVVEIWSFNQDYFVDQGSKRSGVKAF